MKGLSGEPGQNGTPGQVRADPPPLRMPERNKEDVQREEKGAGQQIGKKRMPNERASSSNASQLVQRPWDGA